MEMHISKWDTCSHSDLRIKLFTMLLQILQDFFHRLVTRNSK